jgi:high-affinity iron transporter
VLSVAFVGNAVRSLQEADVLSVTPVNSTLVRLPVFAAELTGIHPTVQGLVAQGILLAVFIAGALWVFGIGPARAKRRATTTEVQAA